MKRQRREIALLIGLAALGFLLAHFQSAARAAGSTDTVSSMVRQLIAPPARGLSAIADLAGDSTRALANGRRLEEENKRLRQFEAAANRFQSTIDSMQQEIDSLRKLGHWDRSPGREKVAADVIGIFPHESRITLNVGLDHGLKRGMPVATYEGLVGRIETVDRSTSQALLITSTSLGSRIGALIQRAPPNVPPAGLIRGTGPALLTLELADPAATVVNGDTVITGGFSDQIPRGIVIGRVIAVQDDPAFGRRTALVAPRVLLGNIREVFVIK